MYFACEKYIQSLGKEKEGCPARIVLRKSFSESTGEENYFPRSIVFSCSPILSENAFLTSKLADLNFLHLIVFKAHSSVVGKRSGAGCTLAVIIELAAPPRWL